jgi:spore germination protein YaaH
MPMKLKQDCWVGWAIAAIVLSSCWDQTTSQRQQPDIKREISLKAVPLDKTKVVMGQTVYVPIYSHIYHYNSQDHVMNLSATLSIRNTDLTNSIIITSVR